jgi:hypothetical protein
LAKQQKEELDMVAKVMVEKDELNEPIECAEAEEVLYRFPFLPTRAT